MESRKITIVLSSTQDKKTIMSNATTLGELKRDLDENQISYVGMTFYEGLTKTELKTDESLLPINVPYRGSVTNELVFMLSVPNKKINSGASDRPELIQYLKDNNLTEELKKKTGKNYTITTTDDIRAFVIEHKKGSSKKSKTVEAAPQKEDKVTNSSSLEQRLESLEKRVALLENKGCKCEEQPTPKKEVMESSYNDGDIDAMFADMQ